MTSRYRLIASELRQSLESGGWSPGSRIISARQLAKREHVSVPTATEALRCLEAEGLIMARPRSGYFVRSQAIDAVGASRPAKDPQPVTMSAMARSLFRSAQTPLVPFGAALPNPGWLPVRELQRALASAGRLLGSRAQSYSVPPGHPELRRQIAARAAMWGATYGPDEIVITAGATQSLRLALRSVCRNGDSVAIESPAYFGTLLLLEGLGLQAVEIATHPQTGLDVTALQDAIRRIKIAAVIASPAVQNPLGASMPENDKRALVDLLSRAAIPLIEDDVYGDLAGGDHRLPPCKAFDRDGNVIYCSSFSKVLAPGWRLGWISAGRYHDRVLQTRFAEDWAGSPVLETAMAHFLAAGDYERHLRKLKPLLSMGVRTMSARISENFPAGTRVSRPAAGFLLWVELPSSIDALDIYRTALSEQIGVSPGHLFSPQSTYTHHLRLNCANEPTPQILRAIDRLGAICDHSRITKAKQS